MKNIVYILVCASVIFFTACSSQDKNKKDGTQVLMQDSTEIAGPQRMQVSDVKTSFTYKGKEYQISSMAIYQLHNAALALKAYEILDYENDEEKTKKALYHSKWNGRFDIVRENPRVILDGAHNIDGVKALSESIKGLKGTKAVLFGALKTKEYQKMIKELEKVADRIVFTGFSHPLALKKEDYQGYEYVDDFKKAYEILLKEYDNIIIAGSLYFISDFASSNIL